MNNQNMEDIKVDNNRENIVDDTFVGMVQQRRQEQKLEEKKDREDGDFVIEDSLNKSSFEVEIPSDVYLENDPSKGLDMTYVNFSREKFFIDYMEERYQKSIEDGTKNQIVEGEMYVGKNPTLAKFIADAKKKIVRKITTLFDSSVRTSERIDFGSTNETPYQVPSMEVPASVTPLSPSSIFDDDTIQLSPQKENLGGVYSLDDVSADNNINLRVVK